MSALTVYAVATSYAWDVVESAWRAGLDPVCMDKPRRRGHRHAGSRA